MLPNSLNYWLPKLCSGNTSPSSLLAFTPVNGAKSIKGGGGTERGEPGLGDQVQVFTALLWSLPDPRVSRKSGCSAQVELCLMSTRGWQRSVSAAERGGQDGCTNTLLFTVRRSLHTSGLDCGFPAGQFCKLYPVLNVQLVFLKFNFEMLGLFSLCI